MLGQGWCGWVGCWGGVWKGLRCGDSWVGEDGGREGGCE